MRVELKLMRGRGDDFGVYRDSDRSLARGFENK